MWFCTEAGMNRFDGKTFDRFTIKDGLADNDNFSCLEDKKGRIWLSSYNGKLSYFEGTRFKNASADASLRDPDTSHLYINGMIEDTKGNIWFSKFGNRCVYYYNGKINVKKNFPDNFWKPKYPNIRLFFLYNDTVCYLHSRRGSLFSVNTITKAATALVYRKYSREDALTRPIWKQVGNSLYFLINSGLRKLRNDSALMVIRESDIDPTGIARIGSFHFFIIWSFIRI